MEEVKKEAAAFDATVETASNPVTDEEQRRLDRLALYQKRREQADERVVSAEAAYEKAEAALEGATLGLNRAKEYRDARYAEMAELEATDTPSEEVN